MESAPSTWASARASGTALPAFPDTRPDVDEEASGSLGSPDRAVGEEVHDLSRVQDAAERLAVTAAPAQAGDPNILPRVIALANQKGGVGKTTTTVNLGAALAEADYRVLLVDLDPQGNASTGVGLNLRNINVSIYDVLLSDAPLEDCIEPTSVRNLFVAPSTIDLAGAEIELVPVFSREMKLRRALAPVRDEFDYVLIDCPPSLGLLTVNALAAADDVIVPIQCEYYALEGLGQLLKNVQLIQTNLNPSLRVRGIALTMFDARTKLAEQVERDVRRFFRDTVYRTVIPRTVRLSEAPSFGQPITTFDPIVAGRHRLPGTRQGGQSWSDAAGWVGGWAPSSPPPPARAGAASRSCRSAPSGPTPYQPRQHFDEESLATLSDSIREVGVLQPVLVRPAARRRLRAHRRRAPLAGGPARRHPDDPGPGADDVDDAAALEHALVENLHRADLNPLEEAAAYQQLIEDFELTHDEVAVRVGRSRASITNTLRLLQLPPSIQRQLQEGSLTMGHARALLGTPDRAFQEQLARRVAGRGPVGARGRGGGPGPQRGGPPTRAPSRRGHHGGGRGPAPVAGLIELEERLATVWPPASRSAWARRSSGAGSSWSSPTLEDLERIYRLITDADVAPAAERPQPADPAVRAGSRADSRPRRSPRRWRRRRAGAGGPGRGGRRDRRAGPARRRRPACGSRARGRPGSRPRDAAGDEGVAQLFAHGPGQTVARLGAERARLEVRAPADPVGRRQPKGHDRRRRRRGWPAGRWPSGRRNRCRASTDRAVLVQGPGHAVATTPRPGSTTRATVRSRRAKGERGAAPARGSARPTARGAAPTAVWRRWCQARRCRRPPSPTLRCSSFERGARLRAEDPVLAPGVEAERVRAGAGAIPRRHPGAWGSAGTGGGRPGGGGSRRAPPRSGDRRPRRPAGRAWPGSRGRPARWPVRTAPPARRAARCSPARAAGAAGRGRLLRSRRGRCGSAVGPPRPRGLSR